MRRNPERFPEDFWFELRRDELAALRSQNVTANSDLILQIARSNRVNHGAVVGFTKGGALALSGVLRTPVANAVSVQIVRAIVAMEDRAIADAKFMVQKLHMDVVAKKPIYARIKQAHADGWTLEQVWKATNYPRYKIEEAVREMVTMRMIPGLLAGMQPGLFDA